MIKKILLLFFAVLIILQAAVVIWWNFSLKGQVKLIEMSYLDGSSSNDLLVDRQDQVWASYLYPPILKVYKNGELMATFSEKELSLKPGHLAVDPQGNIWAFASDSPDGISIYDGQTWKHLKGGGDFFIWDAGVDSQGRAWIGANDGLHVYENGQWAVFNTSNSSIPDDNVKLLAFDHQGQVWVVSGQGLAATNGKKWKTFEDSPLNGKTITDLAIDQNGYVWVGVQDGLYFFDGSQWIIYTPKNSGMETVEVDQLAVDQQNRVWFAGSKWDKTVTVFEGKKWKYLYGEGYWSGIDSGADGNIYLNDNGVRKVALADTRLVNPFEKYVLGMADFGAFTYLTIALIGLWLMFALNAWGIGVGLIGGLLVFLPFAIAYQMTSSSGFLGIIATVGGILGGLIGYFFKRSGKKNADLWGGAIGCAVTFLVAGCCTLSIAGLTYLTMQ
jgi:hypothetical protein